MNTNLLNALKQIISKYDCVVTLSDARRMKALLADFATSEPKPQKNALVVYVEHGFVPLLQNVTVTGCGAAKAQLTECLNRDEGLDKALCADTLNLLATHSVCCSAGRGSIWHCTSVQLKRLSGAARIVYDDRLVGHTMIG